MKTKTYQVYTFAELSETAKQRAKDKYANLFGFNWSTEYLESLKALAEHFGGELTDWNINWFHLEYSDAKFTMPDENFAYDPCYDADHWNDKNAAKLTKLGSFDPVTLKGTGQCVLTGFCADESAIDGLRIAWHAGERDLDKLMQAAFKTWLKDAQADCEDFYSDAQFAEHCEANGYEFDENGDLD